MNKLLRVLELCVAPIMIKSPFSQSQFVAYDKHEGLMGL